MKFSFSTKSIDLLSFAEGLHGPEEGAVVRFFGTARKTSHEATGEVIRLHYEAFEGMAESEMEKIFQEAAEKFSLGKAVVIHRVGDVELGEAAVAIAVATPHREEGFAACRYLIDELKKRVPIWKKEFYRDGSSWVSCRP